MGVHRLPRVLLALCCACAAADGEADPSERPSIDETPETDEVLEIPLNGCIYYRTASFTIGAQTFAMLVDSGSATLAVAAEGCSTCSDAGVSVLYDSSQGTSLGTEVATSYDSGNMGWSGTAYEDVVGIEGFPSTRMRFVAVAEQDSIFGDRRCDDTEHVPVDGIVGLAPDELLHPDTDSFLTTFVDAMGLSDEFAVQTCHSGGTLWLGGYNLEATLGEMAYVPLNEDEDEFYTIEVRSFTVENSSGEGTTVSRTVGPATWTALLDTGGPNLILPEAAYDSVVAAISEDPDLSVFGGAWWDRGYVDAEVPPEEIDASLPWVTVELENEVTLRLPPTESYVSWWANGSGTWTYWTSLVNGGEIGWGNYVDLGNLPMTSYVVSTDRAVGRVGFAPAASCP